jgi:hypothetical protein
MSMDIIHDLNRSLRGKRAISIFAAAQVMLPKKQASWIRPTDIEISKMRERILCRTISRNMIRHRAKKSWHRQSADKLTAVEIFIVCRPQISQYS